MSQSKAAKTLEVLKMWQWLFILSFTELWAIRHTISLSFCSLLHSNNTWLQYLWRLKETLNLTAIRARESTFIEHPLWAGPFAKYHFHTILIRQISFPPFNWLQSEAQRAVTQTVRGRISVFSSALWPLNSRLFHHGLSAGIGCYFQNSIRNQMWKPVLRV